MLTVRVLLAKFYLSSGLWKISGELCLTSAVHDGKCSLDLGLVYIGFLKGVVAFLVFLLMTSNVI